jgi:hypothetical protein
MLQAMKCLLGVHAYQLLGMIDKDKVFVCKQCGVRYTEFYTLRIDRIGFAKDSKRQDGTDKR